MKKRLFLSLLALFFLATFPTLLAAAEKSPSSSTSMVLIQTIGGDISPKSVRSSGTGLVSAHNMMYRHSVTLYDADDFSLIKTIPDQVNLAKLGFVEYSGLHKGAPVEGAYSPDGQYLYVTNYAMYGKGFNHEGHDVCTPNSGYDRSFLYRINLTSFTIDAAYKVGVVPKVVEVTPDNRYILVSNWCSYDLHILSVATQKIVKIIKIGAYPRGITVSADSHFAYVAQMGGSVIHQINLDDFVDTKLSIGANPRSIVLAPDQKTLFATLNSSGKVVAFDLAKKKVVQSVVTGKAARSLAISSDGSALFVVNFLSNTLSKIQVSNFKVLQTIKVCNEPIGITYEKVHDRTWVACYGGSIKIFDNK